MQTLPNWTAVIETANHPQSIALPENELTQGVGNSDEAPPLEPVDIPSAGVIGKNGGNTLMVQPTGENVMEVQEEFSSPKFVRVTVLSLPSDVLQL